jgi:hypothetical protein
MDESFNKTPAEGEARQGWQDKQDVQMEPTPIPEPLSHKKLVISIAAVFVLVVAGTAGAYFFFTQQDVSKPVACTQEAKQCPDGSYVGRAPSSCEFEDCPVVKKTNAVDTSNWVTYKSDIHGWEIRHPSEWTGEEIGRLGRIFTLHSSDSRGPDSEEFRIALRYDHDINQALTYAPELKPITISGFVGLIGEISPPHGKTGILAYAQAETDSYEFRKRKLTSQDSKENRELFNAILSTVKLTTLQQLNERAEDRDITRVVDFENIKLTLELYFDANGVYPPNLDEAFPKTTPPLDPLTDEPYNYIRGPSTKEFHLGVSLETSFQILQKDSDFNSLSADWLGGFDGGDSKLCMDEDVGIACYDIKRP